MKRNIVCGVVAVICMMMIGMACGWDGNFFVYNMCDKTILVRMEIDGVIYNDMALEKSVEGKLGCEEVWYTIRALEANTNKELCNTGTPVSEYCGADIVIKGNADTGYICGM
ncbi:hypothetical protein Pelo_2127 [Pelomyxa schiedti]|nr:hypothetical protein Pelo_2127 [Pelomyxa schiedti]